MKEQKTMIQLLSRYEQYPLTPYERFGMGMLAIFFAFMLFMFFVLPNL